MNHMDKKGTYIIAAIVVLAVIGFAVISLQRSTLDTTTSEKLEYASTTDWENAPAGVIATPKTVVTAKHAYRSGEHIIAGEVPLPSPCEILESKAVASGDRTQVAVQLVSTVKTGERCEPAITPARFKVSAKAEKNAAITATLNGVPVTLNLIEAGANENLDDFELYIKG